VVRVMTGIIWKRRRNMLLLLIIMISILIIIIIMTTTLQLWFVNADLNCGGDEHDKIEDEHEHITWMLILMKIRKRLRKR
jgi:hypothetical protein